MQNHEARPTAGRHVPRSTARAVVTASGLGGVTALSTVLAHLPHNFSAPIVVAQHRGLRGPYSLDEVLARRTPLNVKYAEEGDTLHAGTVYIAMPHAHLVVRPDGHLSYANHRKVRFLRSAANPLFESASQVFGKGLVAVVLTGRDSDATDGVQSVKKHGGTVIAQDKKTSQLFDMPRTAIATGCVDQVLPLERIADALKALMTDHVPTENRSP